MYGELQISKIISVKTYINFLKVLL